MDQSPEVFRGSPAAGGQTAQADRWESVWQPARSWGSAAEAVAGMQPGMRLMVAGFGSVTSWPSSLLRAIAQHGAGDLTVIANTVGYSQYSPQALDGLVSTFIASFGGSAYRETALQSQIMAGTIDFELVPQGTLAERIRAGRRRHRGVLHAHRRGHRRGHAGQGVARDQRPPLPAGDGDAGRLHDRQSAASGRTGQLPICRHDEELRPHHALGGARGHRRGAGGRPRGNARPRPDRRAGHLRGRGRPQRDPRGGDRRPRAHVGTRRRGGRGRRGTAGLAARPDGAAGRAADQGPALREPGHRPAAANRALAGGPQRARPPARGERRAGLPRAGLPGRVGPGPVSTRAVCRSR